MVAAFIDSSQNMALGVSPLQKAAAAQEQVSAASASEGKNSPDKPRRGLFGPDGFSFSSFLDIINPLQHIPVVNTIYRAVTGDTIENGSRIIGGTLFGGPIGFLASVFNGIVDEETGTDMGGHALAALGFDNAGQAATTALAQNTPPASKTDGLATLQGGQAMATQKAPPAVELAEGAMPEIPGASMQEAPIGAMSGLISRSWGDTRQAQTQNLAHAQNQTPSQAQIQAQAQMQAQAVAQAAPRPTTVIPYRQTTPGNAAVQQQNAVPQQNTAAVVAALSEPQRQAREDDGRKWFPTANQQGGIATRGVGVQPVNTNAIAQKFGVSRGTGYAGAEPKVGTVPPNPQQVPADFAERANAAYQKYLDMKQSEPRRRAVDQSF